MSKLNLTTANGTAIAYWSKPGRITGQKFPSQRELAELTASLCEKMGIEHGVETAYKLGVFNRNQMINTLVDLKDAQGNALNLIVQAPKGSKSTSVAIDKDLLDELNELA